MMVKLEKDNEREKKKAVSVYQIARKIYPTRKSEGENVTISFKLNFSIIVFEENGCCWTPAFFALPTLGLE